MADIRLPGIGAFDEENKFRWKEESAVKIKETTKQAVAPDREFERELAASSLKEPLATEDKDLPGNEIEKKLAKAWQRVLGIREFSVHDHFFELGGNSMKAVQIAGFLKK